MKKMIYNAIAICLSVVFIMSAASCSNEEAEKRKYENIVCNNIFMNDIPDFIVVESEYKINDNGDIEQYYVIEFDEKSGTEFWSKIKRIQKWTNLPIVTSYFNLCNYVTLLPECTIKKASDSFAELNKISNGMYFFEDRTYDYEKRYRHQLKNDLDLYKSKSLSDKIDLSDGIYSQDDILYYEYAMDFSTAIYDADNYRLYVYICDKAYVKN